MKLKNYIISLFMLLSTVTMAQLPYTWTPGVNPGWTSTNPGAGGALNWNGGCLGGVVTTNCAGNYANNQNTFYTSPIINASCATAPDITVSFQISGNAESTFDFLFCEYSTNGGGTWTNFYGPGIGLTGNAGAYPGIIWTLPVIPTAPSLMFRFNFTSDATFRYSGYKIINFQIVCNTTLPIELISFDGYNNNTYNNISWVCASENNNDYFTLERSNDGYSWEELSKINGAGNTSVGTMYQYKDYTFKRVDYNYYRLKQTDYNGHTETFNIIVVDNTNSKTEAPTLIGTYNQYGQEVNSNYTGFIIERYSDGSSRKIFKQ